MTPDSPDEALHFRGKTLTPESPRPLHVAEPANIPLLQNQMDPVFNDTTTYEKLETTSEDSYRVQENGSLSCHVQYAGLGEVRGAPTTTDCVQDPPQPPLQHQQQAYLEATTAPVIPPLPSPSLPSQISESFKVQQATANSSLTSCPPSDPPISLLAHPVPGPPPSTSHIASSEIPFANKIDSSVASLTAQSPSQNRLDPENSPDDNSPEGGVDFQNLLDNLPPSSTAPSAPTVSQTANDTLADTPSAAGDEALQSSLGLPPRPPPQEKPSIHPNYNPSNDIRSYHQLPAHNTSNASNPFPAQQSSYQSNNNNTDNNTNVGGHPTLAAAGAPGTSLGTSSLPPPPVASFQQPPSVPIETQEPPAPANPKSGRLDRQAARSSKVLPDEDTPWGPEVQKKYDEFLHDERVYVTEGLWDRFPYGSRLFVGNLPTERVTKRDLYHVFHHYGKLAQISIKQAYGFIQFLDASACKKALDLEQGAVVRGRKVHLEISKPQRNTRPGPAAAETSRAPASRRSHSPDFSRAGPSSGRNARASGDRYDRPYEPARVPFSDFRDEPTHRRRDDYRPPPRSPSPRSYRVREGYRSRERTPERFDRRERRRSRSPYGRDRRYRSPSPRGRGAYDSDADLPVPRRAARDVPDVQVLVLEELDRNFIYHVENSFRNRGLRVDVLMLGPRIPLDAAVQRQISEGVLAVVRLSRSSQFARKIPLQVFDRSAGTDHVRSNEYPDLDPHIAAEIVFHARSLQRTSSQAPFATTAYGVQSLPPAPMAQPQFPTAPNPPNLANVIASFDAPTLQSLLSAMQQRPTAVQAAPQPFATSHNHHGAADLASLLSSATRQHVPPNPQQQPFSSQPFEHQAPNAQVVSDPNLLSLLAKGLGTQQPQNQAGLPPHVQNIMSQLGKWKQ